MATKTKAVEVQALYDELLENFLKVRKSIRETQKTYEEKLIAHKPELAYLLAYDILNTGSQYLSKKIEYDIDFNQSSDFDAYFAALNNYFPEKELAEIGYSEMHVHYDILDHAARNIMSSHFTVDYRKSDLGQKIIVRTRN